MNKPVVNMSDWELYVYNDNYNLSGIADRHPTLGTDAYVSYTSKMIRSELAEDILTYETQNTIYVCPLKYMRVQPYRNVIPKYQEELTHRADTSKSDLDNIIAATACIALDKGNENSLAKHIMKLQEMGVQELKQQNEERNKCLIDIANKYEDCIYIEVSNVGSGNKLAYHIGQESGVIDPDIHSGMFQDSILYMQYATDENNGCSLDFRYFPKGLGDIMETYSWSDNIKQAVIKNECDYSICFNGNEIAPGETKIFSPKSHRQGLISPDCHNGKSVFSMQKIDELFDEPNEE